MGADLLVTFIEWRKGKTQKQTDLHFNKMIADARTRVQKLKKMDEEFTAMYGDLKSLEKGEYADHLNTYKTELLDDLDAVHSAYHNGSREAAVMHVGGRMILLTGGMSWGDSPTEMFDSISRLLQSGVVR